MFSQLSSGYWWQASSSAAGFAVRAWTTPSFTRTTGHERGFLERLIEGLAGGLAGGAASPGPELHPDDVEAFARVLAAVLGSMTRGASHDFRLFARDGSMIWVRQRLESRGEGGARRVYASGELVTERKRTEAALGHVAARFLALVEHAPNVIITIDLGGTILFVNRRLSADGREPWQLIGSSAHELVDPSQAQALADAIAEIVASKRAHEFVLCGGGLPSADAQARWYEVQGAPVIRDEEVVAITMILSDVTKRRVAEQALRRSESRWRFLWENVPDRITELDADGRIVVTNRAVGERRPEQLRGTLVFQHLNPKASVALRRAMEAALRAGAPSSYEIALAEPDGRERWWAKRVVPFVEGGAQGFLLIDTDISDFKAAERERANLDAQLRQQQKLEAIGTLASGVAHEINNPIQSIMNYADLVRARAEPGGLVAEFAGEIIAETERVANIVRSLLAFARQEKEQHQPAQLSDIVGSSLTLMRAVLRRDRIALELDVPADLPLIECRGQQLQQVFMNLLTNARDALNLRYPEYDDDKRVKIVARRFVRDGQVWIRTTVEDHGGGIEAAVIDRIFDPFFTTKGRDQGTGLGLSVSHGIVREHRGEIEVESEPGAYTRFHINLRVEPLADMD